MNIKNTSHKIISIITALLLLFSLSIPILSFAETSNISVYIDNKRVSFQANPYMENDRVMVPMRKCGKRSNHGYIGNRLKYNVYKR